MKNDTDPDILALLDEEQEALKSASGRTPRFKLEKDQDAVVRILPAKLGTKKSWWSRCATHWLGQSTRIHCVRKTSPHFGGDPDFKCPVCALVDRYNGDENRKISDAAYALSARTNFDVYLIVRQLNGQKPPRDLRSSASLYTLYSTSAEDLFTLYRRKLQKGVDITDPVHGYDIYIKRGRRGMTIDIDDQCPLFDLDGKELEDAVLDVMSGIHFKLPSRPSRDDYDEFCDKAEDYIKRKGRGDDVDDDRRRGRSDREDERDDRRSYGRDRERSEDRSERYSDRSDRSDRSRSDDSADDSFDIPRSRSRDDDNEDRSTTRTRERERERDTDRDERSDRSRPRSEESDDLDMTPSPPPVPSSRRQAPPPPARRSAPVSETIDENDDVAEERKEHVPPADKLDLTDEDPLPVSEEVTGGSLRDRIRSGIGNSKSSR